MITAPIARNTDPDTSHAAAASVQNVRESQDAVYRILEITGPATDVEWMEAYNQFHELEPEMKLPPQSTSGLRTRRHELVLLGRVIDTGKREIPPARFGKNRAAIIWAVKPT